MFRLEGASAAVREAVPPELVAVFWAVTLLGSAKVLLLGLSLAYWNLGSYREEVLCVVGLAVLALPVTLVLKYGLHLPRPPASVRRVPVDPSPVGFPSGHAIAATVVYGGSLVAVDRLRTPRIATAVAGLVALVGLSRVVIGVHYLGDVLAGFAVGGAVLGLVAVLGAGVRTLLGTATLLSVPALAVTGVSPDALLALGGSLGALGAVTLVRPAGSRGFDSPLRRGAFTAVGLVVVGVGLALAEAAEPVAALVLVVDFLLVFGIVALPALLDRATQRASAA